MTEQTAGPKRSHGPRTPEDDRTLFWASIILVAALIVGGVGAVGQAVGWWTLFLATAATVVVAGTAVLSFIVKRNDQDETVEFEAADNRLLPRFGYIDPSDIADINIVGAPNLPLHSSAEDDPVVDFYGNYTAPQPAKWQVFLREVWLWLKQNWRWVTGFIFWPISFWFLRTTRVAVTWANMTTADKHREAVIEATFRAEEVMWWLICLAFPSLLVYGWFQEDAWVALWHVLISYVLSFVKLWLALAFRRD